MLVALKCDLRERHSDDDDEEDELGNHKEKEMIDYKHGLEVARRIQALRYLGTSRSARTLIPQMIRLIPIQECSAKRNRGVNEAFTEAARVALSVKGANRSSERSKCSVM